jgi:hypothetical protein
MALRRVAPLEVAGHVRLGGGGGEGLLLGGIGGESDTQLDLASPGTSLLQNVTFSQALVSTALIRLPRAILRHSINLDECFAHAISIRLAESGVTTIFPGSAMSPLVGAQGLKWILLCLAIAVSLILVQNVAAQRAERMHELRTATDSTGGVHLFYRIESSAGWQAWYDNSVYHYDVSAATHSLFLRDFSYVWDGTIFSTEIAEYRFFQNDRARFIYATNYCEGECSSSISRHDTTGITWWVFHTIDRLFASGSDTDWVAVKAGTGPMMVSPDGGLTWGDPDEVPHAEDDTLVIDFPIIAVDPSNPDILFGVRTLHPASTDPLWVSFDRGRTSQPSSSLQPRDGSVHFDPSGATVYFLAWPVDQEGQTRQLLLRSEELGTPGTWEEIELNQPLAGIVAHPINEGHLFAFSGRDIYESVDGGWHFDLLFTHGDPINSLVYAANDTKYFASDRGLYALHAGVATQLVSVPTSAETLHDKPQRAGGLVAWPNPFSQKVTISTIVDDSCPTSVIVYSIDGRRTAMLIEDNSVSPGSISIQWEPRDVPSGAYIIQVLCGGRLVATSVVHLVR